MRRGVAAVETCRGVQGRGRGGRGREERGRNSTLSIPIVFVRRRQLVFPAPLRMPNYSVTYLLPLSLPCCTTFHTPLHPIRDELGYQVCSPYSRNTQPPLPPLSARGCDGEKGGGSRKTPPPGHARKSSLLPLSHCPGPLFFVALEIVTVGRQQQKPQWTEMGAYVIASGRGSGRRRGGGKGAGQDQECRARLAETQRDDGRRWG